MTKWIALLLAIAVAAVASASGMHRDRDVTWFEGFGMRCVSVVTLRGDNNRWWAIGAAASGSLACIPALTGDPRVLGRLP